MSDEFSEYSIAPDGPAERSFAIVPSNDDDLAAIPRAILVGVAGNITGRLKDDAADIVYPVLAGYHPLRFKKIAATGTTATGLVGLL